MKRIETIQPKNRQTGFSLIELLIAITIILVVLGIAFYLVAQTFNQRNRYKDQLDALADGNQALALMSKEITNAGFGLTSNGLSATECTEDKIRIRANLNALMKQTSSNSVTDPDEDVEFFLLSNPNGGNVLVRNDIATATSTIIATQIDNTDINGDGDGDGLTFHYLDENGNPTAPQNAVKVEVMLRIVLPQIGQPDSPGFQPQVTKQLFSNVVLRNTRLIAY